MASQEELAKLWLEAPEGSLCGREQAKAWALREVWKQEEKGTYGMLPFIASRLRKMSDGQPGGEAPSKQAVEKLLAKIGADPDWVPGKHSDTPRGPKRKLRATTPPTAKLLPGLPTRH